MAKNTFLRKCRNSFNRFLYNKQLFENHLSFEDWYLDAMNIDESQANREVGHFETIKRYFIVELKKKDYYISSSALDEIIFYCIKTSNSQNFIVDVSNQIQLHQLDCKSLVIFPIHNFGFQFMGFKNIFNSSLTILKYKNFQVNSQTNSLDKTLNLINNYSKIAINSKIDDTLLNHFYLSRNLKWLTKNPLLVFDFNFSQLNPFENTDIILEKLAHITNQLYFISVLRSENSELGRLFSTKNTNNWETLDLKHFITINSFNNSIFCKPIHYNYELLFNEMHLNIDLLSSSKKVIKWEEESIKCLEVIYEGNKNYLLSKEITYIVYHKISNSLKYFRRSVKSVNLEDKIININIAIEALLLDNEGDKVAKILYRLKKSLKYYRNQEKLFTEVDKVIKERNNIIHNAIMENSNIDFAAIYRMYCKVVQFITLNINSIDFNKTNKMNDFFSKI